MGNDNLTRKIVYITGTRADYGLMQSVLKKIDNQPSLKLEIIITGMHLMHEFGRTYREVEKDGFIVRDGERIAQFVIQQVCHVELEEVDKLPETTRGEGGFGHTGL